MTQVTSLPKILEEKKDSTKIIIDINLGMNRLTYINIKLLLWSKENFSLARKKNAVKVYRMARAAHERRAQAKPQESSASIYPTTALASHISPRLCLRSSLVCCPCHPTNFDGILSIRTSRTNSLCPVGGGLDDQGNRDCPDGYIKIRL